MDAMALTILWGLGAALVVAVLRVVREHIPQSPQAAATGAAHVQQKKLQQALARCQALTTTLLQQNASFSPKSHDMGPAAQIARRDSLQLRLLHDQAQRLMEFVEAQKRDTAQALQHDDALKSALKALAKATHGSDNRFAQHGAVLHDATLQLQAITELLQSLHDASLISSSRASAALEEWQNAHQLLQQFDGTTEALQQNIAAVKELASRAKLLSLNAAIVASQSQEHGRGFSVVADQIKALAQRAQGTAQSMQEGVHGVQQFSEKLQELAKQQEATLGAGNADHQASQQLVARAAVANQTLSRMLQEKTASLSQQEVGTDHAQDLSSQVMNGLVEAQAAARLQEKEFRRAHALADELVRNSEQLAKSHTEHADGEKEAQSQTHDDAAKAARQLHDEQQQLLLGQLQQSLAEASACLNLNIDASRARHK